VQRLWQVGDARVMRLSRGSIRPPSLSARHVAANHDRIRARGVDLSQLPDPVEELGKVRDASY